VSCDDLIDRAVSVIETARRAGADGAEAYMARSRHLEIKVVNGRLERTEESRDAGCGLRVERGIRQGFASTTDLSSQGLGSLVEVALAIAARAPEDPHGGLPEPEGTPSAALDLLDPEAESVPWATAVEMALRAEAAAVAADSRVTAGEGSTFARARGDVAIASSKGIRAGYSGSRCAIGCAPIAIEGGERQRQVWHEGRRFLSELPSPEEVGARAAERAVRMLGARTLPSGRASVVFDPVEAGRFWGGLVPALLGDSIRRRISCLRDDLGRRVASEVVTLIDDPLIPRGPGSRPFDGEGLPTSRIPLLASGVLQGFLYDSRTARRAGTRSTGSAQRGYSSSPSPGAHALQLLPGPHQPAEILKAAGEGLYVTHLIGFGLNLVTGDYSRGANGIWFEGGEPAFAVHEVTLSGNLRDLLPGIVMVGNDLVRRSAHASPTFLMEGLVISGSGVKKDR